MIKRNKGVGGLSRKLSAILIVAAMPLSGPMAQTVAPTGPNKVYIEQVGNLNTVTIEQVGVANTVGGVAAGGASNTNYGTITGSSNTVGITQTGDGNSAQ